MYKVGDWLGLIAARDGVERADAARPAVPRNVWLLGLTSLFTDISSEMVASVLPIYLVGFLRMSPASFGIVDGLYQGVAGLVQLASAAVTDRLKRYKEMAALGYGASVLCRVGLLATNGAAGVTAFLTLDRLGKGMRSAPRDALISLSVPRQQLGFAFGVHRAMDAMGALLGPIAAFLVLRSITNGFDVVFVVSLCAAIVGFAVMALLVENRPGGDVLSSVGGGLRNVLRETPAFRHLAIAAFLLGATTISDNFIYLALQRRVGISSGSFPLLYVVTSAVYLIFAVPIGRLADRWGRFGVFVAGHALLVFLYAILLAQLPSTALIAAALLLLGLYYAATEGVLMALGSAILPEELRTSGLALLTTALVLARFAGSTIFGVVWTRLGLPATISGFLVGLVIAISVIVAVRPREARS